MAVRPGAQVRVASVALAEAHVPADRYIDPHIACVRWHSRSHTSVIESVCHLLKSRHDDVGQTKGSRLTETLLGSTPACYFIAGLGQPSLVVSEDGVELLLDVFGHYAMFCM